MGLQRRTTGLLLSLAVLAAGCVAPSGRFARSSEADNFGGPIQPGAPKRIVAAMGLEVDFQPGTSGPGVRELRQLVGAGLTIVDDRGERRGQLAEVFPSLENGLWKLLPDGRMETTWKLRPNARWHDGTLFTADDVLFTGRVLQDRSLPSFVDPDFNSIEGLDAPDPSIVIVTWKGPFINADALLSGPSFKPMPKHVLEEPYLNEKANFVNLPFWTDGYVGTGPYKMQAWIPGSHFMFEANEQYVFGKPRIDEIELRFISNRTTLTANILGGSVDLNLGPGLSVEQGLELRHAWAAGEVAFELDDFWIAVYPQFVNPSPALVADLRFRRALVHAIDRDEMAAALQAGLAPVAHSFLSPNDPDHRATESRLVRYGHDPRRAAQMIEELGYTKGADGAFRDATGRRLEAEIHSADVDIPMKSMLSLADYWQKAGVAVSPVSYARIRLNDYAFSAPFPAFLVLNRPNGAGTLNNLLSSRARLPENNFQAAGVGNWSRYMNPEFDVLITRYQTTIPKTERAHVLGDIVHHISDQLTIMGLFYNPTPTAIANRLANVSTGRASGTFVTWNAHEWEVR